MIDDFKRVYPGNSDVPFVDFEAEAFFQCPASFEIMMIVTSEAGTTREKTLEEFGKKGLAVLEGLLERGVLSEENDRIFNKGKINARQETTYKLMQNLVGLSYDLENFGNNRNWLSVQYESVNFDVVAPQMRKIYVNAYQEIRKLLDSPESKGDDVIWAGLAMDSLTKGQKLLSKSKGDLMQ